jgi:L1 cell adhesion molecule like protein
VDWNAGQENVITITSDQGHNSKEDIEQMIQEAEKYKDEKQRDKESSKNLLESYAFNMKATVEDELRGKINDEDKQKILDKGNEIINWLDKNQTAEKENLSTNRKSWRKSATPSLPSCTRVQEACQEECLGLSWWGSSSLWWCLLRAHH